MNIMQVYDINELLNVASQQVLEYGRLVTVRGKLTKELHPAFIEIKHPLKRTLLYPYRGNNPFQTLFETLWVLGAKDNSIKYLQKFLPRAPNYSDDGLRWRAGYPERIRAYGNKTKVDQLTYVYEKLKADPETRQAIISFWNPAEDCFGECCEDSNKKELKTSLDFPCSQNLQFLIRDGKLDCTFFIRSNDVIFGMTSINFYEFSVIQEILAYFLNVKVGSFYYFVNSLHLYEEHFEKAEKLVYGSGREYADYLDHHEEDFVTEYDLPCFRFAITPPKTTFREYMGKIETVYENICNHIDGKPEKEYPEELRDVANLCLIYLDCGEDKEKYTKRMFEVEITDLKASCHFWFAKKWKTSSIDAINEAIEECIWEL